jgi:cobalt-zinc-cadmium efflux system outer membrane protein
MFSLPAVLSSQDAVYTLEDIVALAIERNPRIAAGALEMAARESAYQASRRLFNPQLEFHLGRAESHDQQIDRKTFSLAITQPIENPVKRHHRIEIEKNAWEESLQSQACRIMEVVFDIKVRFYSFLLLQEKERLLEKIIESVREMEHLVRKRAELGEVKHLDMIKLRVEVLKAENEHAALRAEMEQGRENLNILLGNALAPDFKVSGKLEFQPVSLDTEALIDRALAGHPLVRARVERLEQWRSNVLFIKGQRFPEFALTGFTHSELDGINRGVGIGLVIPLWNFKSNELAEAVSLSRMSEQELSATRLELARDIRACTRRVRLADKTLTVFTTALLRQVEESLKIAEVSYREGEISLLDFLDSQRTYNSVLGDYYQALFNWNVEMAALEKAAGASIR